jgi:L-amino acid N-acyltransferase YncA
MCPSVDQPRAPAGRDRLHRPPRPPGPRLRHRGGARALLAIAFEDYELHRVCGRLEPRNEASARVLEKLGMRREGLLVENEWVKGEWQSELIYALLAREWAERGLLQ